MITYNLDMSQKFGSHLKDLRKAAGLSQKALGTLLGVPQSNISFWEKCDKPPRGEILPTLAQALNISVDEILGIEPIKPKKQQAAKGKLQQLFEAASQMPRRQQEKIISVLEPFVAAHVSNRAA